VRDANSQRVKDLLNVYWKTVHIWGRCVVKLSTNILVSSGLVQRLSSRQSVLSSGPALSLRTFLDGPLRCRQSVCCWSPCCLAGDKNVIFGLALDERSYPIHMYTTYARLLMYTTQSSYSPSSSSPSSPRSLWNAPPPNPPDACLACPMPLPFPFS
jgi:hypothetical protein